MNWSYQEEVECFLHKTISSSQKHVHRRHSAHGPAASEADSAEPHPEGESRPRRALQRTEAGDHRGQTAPGLRVPDGKRLGRT